MTTYNNKVRGWRSLWNTWAVMEDVGGASGEQSQKISLNTERGGSDKQPQQLIRQKRVQVEEQRKIVDGMRQ